MSISTYSELKTAVANWLNRSDLTAYIPDFIRLAEERIYSDLRVRAMETALNSTISNGVIAVPNDYIELKYAYIDGSPVQRLTKKDEAFIYEKYPTRAAGGKPQYIAREIDNFIFGPYPDFSYVVKGGYYKRLDALSDSNTTNWFLTNNPSLLLFGSLAEAEPFLKNDERIAIWEQKYLDTKNRIQKEDESEKFSGSPLTVTVSNY
jgi:hypothetical protein